MNTTAETARLGALDRAHHLHPFTDPRRHSAEGGRIISRAEHIYISARTAGSGKSARC